jgi:hypothetical protein
VTTGSNDVDIANQGLAGDSGTIRIGADGAQKRAFPAGVSGASIPGATQLVRVNANGQLGTVTAASTDQGTERTSSDRGLSRLRAEVERLERQVQRLRATPRAEG